MKAGMLKKYQRNNDMQEFTPFAQLAMSATAAASSAGRYSRFLREASHYAEKDWQDTTTNGSACYVARDGTTGWQAWDERGFVAAEDPKEATPPKYDPGGARQMWQPGYPRILMRGEKNPALMPRYNQVQHTARPLHGRRGRG
jgi:hypothetical protein